MDVFETCKLCRNKRKLCESHIIPKFIWKCSGIIGAKKKFAVKCVSTPALSEHNKQDGFKEYLLCSECEDKLQKYEVNVSRVFSGAIRRNSLTPKTHFIWAGWDYKKTKLFQMSVLWRMGVSSLPFYSHVKLGPHEERLRKLLLEDNPAEPWRYGCTAVLLNHRGNPVPGIFSQPLLGDTTKLGKHRYRIVIAGMLWVFDVSSHQHRSLESSAPLQLNGEWPMIIGEIMDFPELRLQIHQLLED